MTDNPTLIPTEHSSADQASEMTVAATVIIERGQTAWAELRRANTWERWIAVGEALDIGRQEAMRTAHTNRPNGRPYGQAFSRWLKEHGFDDIHETDRSFLTKCIQSRAAIEKWRAVLTEPERLSLNHPQRVFEKWKAATHVPEPGEKPPSAMAKLRAENQALRESKDVLAKQLKTNSVWGSGDSAGEIVVALTENLMITMSEAKALKVLEQVRLRLKEQWATAREAQKVKGETSRRGVS